MRILVNYHPSEKKYIPQLAYYLKRHNLQAMTTALPLEIGQLLDKARAMNAQGILLCNPETLANCVSGKKPTLDLYRGSLLKFSIPTIVCNSLEHINTVTYGPWLLEKDLAKFHQLRNPSPAFEFTVLENEVRFEEAYFSLSKCICLAFDIETAKFNDSADSLQAPDSLITCASWTGLREDGKMITYVLPFVDFGVDHWETDEEYGRAIQLMRDINKLPMPKVMQNGMYDCVHTLRYHAEPHNWTLDTLGLAHAEYSELPKSLDFIASYMLHDHMQWKTEAEEASKSKDIKRYWGYNAKDTWVTMRILIQQLRTQQAYARTNYADTFKLVYPALYCAFEGWLIDQDKRLELRTKSQEVYDRSLQELQVMMDDPNFNPGSWQQVSHYLYNVFGAKNPKIGKSKSGTDEKNLKVVAQQHPLLALITERILDYKKAQKAIGTYYDFKQYNSRLLYNINPFGTETDRMASQASSLWCGTQVQNIPYYAKEMLIADPGYEICEIDNKQSEARCTAYLARCRPLQQALETPDRDFYKTLGTLFFQIPYEEVDDFFRNKVLKKIVHGTNYRMGAKTFMENIGAKILYETAPKLGITIVDIPRKNHPKDMTLVQFAGYLLELYHVPFPEIRAWYNDLKHEIMTTAKLTSPLGHVRHFFGDISKGAAILNSAVAHGPQNLSVKILNKGFWRLYKECVLPSHGKFRLKGQVHDSCKFQYPIEERDIWIPKALECMTNPVQVHGQTLAIPLDAEYGSNWANKVAYHADAK